MKTALLTTAAAIATENGWEIEEMSSHKYPRCDRRYVVIFKEVKE